MHVSFMYINCCLSCTCLQLGTTEIGAISIDEIVVADIEVELRDVPDLGYFASDSVGEVLVRRKRPRVALNAAVDDAFRGYTDNSLAPLAVGSRGFYCTGDVARLTRLPDGRIRLQLIDRLSSIFKLAQVCTNTA